MPQMSPMSWMTLMLIFIMILMIISIMNYFFLKSSFPYKNINNSPTLNKQMIWKW